jgi:hypothetical protein
MGAVGVGGAIHLPDFEVVDLVTFGQLLCEGKASVSGGQINDLANICGILGILGPIRTGPAAAHTAPPCTCCSGLHTAHCTLHTAHCTLHTALWSVQVPLVAGGPAAGEERRFVWFLGPSVFCKWS